MKSSVKGPLSLVFNLSFYDKDGEWFHAFVFSLSCWSVLFNRNPFFKFIGWVMITISQSFPTHNDLVYLILYCGVTNIHYFNEYMIQLIKLLLSCFLFLNGLPRIRDLYVTGASKVLVIPKLFVISDYTDFYTFNIRSKFRK